MHGFNFLCREDWNHGEITTQVVCFEKKKMGRFFPGFASPAQNQPPTIEGNTPLSGASASGVFYPWNVEYYKRSTP